MTAERFRGESTPSRPRVLGRVLRSALAVVVLAVPVTTAAGSPLVPDGDEVPAESPLVTFGIAPASGARPDDRSFLQYDVPPGAVLYDSVAILSSSDQPLTLTTYAADATTQADGSLDLTERSQPTEDLGAWIVVGDGSGSVGVPPQSSETGRGLVVVPVQISVPPGATPGDHVAGVVASLVSTGTNPDAQNIELEQRVAARVYVRVAGELAPQLNVAVTGVRFDATAGLPVPGDVTVDYTVTNTGNVRLGLRSAARITGLLGLAPASADGPEVAEILPGDAVSLSATVADVWPLVRLVATITVDPVAAPGLDSAGADPVSDSRRAWAVPWVLVLALLVLAAAIAAWLVFRRRRRGRRRHLPRPEPRERELVGS